MTRRLEDLTPEQLERRRGIERAYNQRNREKRRAYGAQYRKKNKEKVYAGQLRARSKDPEKYKTIKARWRANNRQKMREDRLLKSFGLTQGQWDALFDAQGRRCAVCDATAPGSKVGWHTDHCHEAAAVGVKKVRGILCHHCNTSIGQAKEDPNRLRALAEYLERNQ